MNEELMQQYYRTLSKDELVKELIISNKTRTMLIKDYKRMVEEVAMKNNIIRALSNAGARHLMEEIMNVRDLEYNPVEEAERIMMEGDHND